MTAARRMARKTPPRSGRELNRLHRILSVRERQLAATVAALKGILKFKSARQSVFATEVEQLQKIAVEALAHAHEIQSGKKPSAWQLTRSPSLLKAKVELNSLYGKFGLPPRGADDGD